MNYPLLQNLRSKLQTRFQAVKGSSYNNLQGELKLLLDFLIKDHITKSIIEDLKTVRVDVPEWKDEVNKSGNISWPTDYRKRAALVLKVAQEFSIASNPASDLDLFPSLSSSHLVDQKDFFIDTIIQPLDDYFDEQIDSGNLPLYLLNKFKARCEWFDSKRLLSKFQNDKKHGEALLDLELRKYLFDQGVDYPFSTPLSPSGRADVTANLDTEDYFIIEVKVFDAKSYGKSYIRSGLKQINDYTRDYNKEFGFLVIFNVSEKELSFNLKSGTNFINIGDKTIFFITINIANPEEPASKRKKLDLYEIGEDYLQELK